jgi:hypothetical protein
MLVRSLFLLVLVAGLAQTPGGSLYLGDNVTGNTPGIAPDECVTAFHISDGILTLEEIHYEGTIDFDGGERYAEIVLGLGTHAVQGSDKPYAGHPALFQRRYARLLGSAVAHADRVVVVNIPWLNWLPEKVDRASKWNGIIAEEAARHRGVCVVDAWGVMAACGMRCISEDGYHPNAEGYARLALAVGRCRGERVYLPVVFAQ